MIPLQPDTLKRIQALYPKEQQDKIAQILENECAKGIAPNNNAELERIRIAVLKMSNGNFDEFQNAIELSQIDWRDVLMSAGFGNDVNAHKRWFPKAKQG
jgi:hypothetical protein